MEFRESFTYSINPSLSAGSGTVFQNTNLKILNYDFDFRRTIHTATSNLIYKKIFDAQTGRYLFKSYDDLRSVSGVALSGITSYGFTPYNWPVAYRASANSDMTIMLADFSGAPNTLYLSYHGDNILKSAPLDMRGEPVDYQARRVRIPIVYESSTITESGTLNGKAQGVIKIDNDSDFVCTRITATSTGAGLILIQDTQRQLYWMDTPAHIANYVGNGQFPNVLTSPRFVGVNTNILITFTNLTGVANTLILYLHGYKRF